MSVYLLTCMGALWTPNICVHIWRGYSTHMNIASFSLHFFIQGHELYCHALTKGRYDVVVSLNGGTWTQTLFVFNVKLQSDIVSYLCCFSQNLFLWGYYITYFCCNTPTKIPGAGFMKSLKLSQTQGWVRVSNLRLLSRLSFWLKWISQRVDQLRPVSSYGLNFLISFHIFSGLIFSLKSYISWLLSF